ncbi:cation:proton antiporter [Kocuria sp.]|uniref:cation:proton antiporter n=1 Tax=Kocuria sp. TaxID=1871328 RepID=UPI0026E0738C|nr:monovalent cation/H(+) antiporter subunit G [Kocuria sp.]MDO5619618.1 monovalent cation/H(+) antiporter subunit G [Kocuria sp.]
MNPVIELSVLSQVSGAAAWAADAITVVAAVAAAVFFTAGTVGLLRFPDLRSRLHALAKADSLGLGFVGLAVVMQVDSVGAAAKVGLVWLLALATAATAAYLLAAEQPTDTAMATPAATEESE